jgi:hypothetical protein
MEVVVVWRQGSDSSLIWFRSNFKKTPSRGLCRTQIKPLPICDYPAYEPPSAPYIFSCQINPETPLMHVHSLHLRLRATIQVAQMRSHTLLGFALSTKYKLCNGKELNFCDMNF